MGLPGDADGQRDVLLQTLRVLEMAQQQQREEEEPDDDTLFFVELVSEWPETPAQAHRGEAQLEPPPIVALLRKKPWLASKLYSGVIPQQETY
jgi:hypothetical protein